MLEKLLLEIQNGETTSPIVLAKKMGTSPAMVRAMLETLERQGFLRGINPQCDPKKSCESCSLANLCSSGSGSIAKIYLENEKGEIPVHLT